MSVISALVLAGGRGRRMCSADKGLLEYRGLPLIQHVLNILEGQVDEIVVSCNRSQDQYAALAQVRQVVSDPVEMPDYAGPLAGIYAGSQVIVGDQCLVVPCDTPNLPDCLVERLSQALKNYPVAAVHDGNRSQPLVMMIRQEVMKLAYNHLQRESSVMSFLGSLNTNWVDFSDYPGAFLNCNRPTDLLEGA